MRYRVGGPLIDGLMAELGMGGGSMDGLLAGTQAPAVGPPRAPASVVVKARPKPISNGNGEAPAA